MVYISKELSAGKSYRNLFFLITTVGDLGSRLMNDDSTQRDSSIN